MQCVVEKKKSIKGKSLKCDNVENRNYLKVVRPMNPFVVDLACSTHRGGYPRCPKLPLRVNALHRALKLRFARSSITVAVVFQAGGLKTKVSGCNTHKLQKH